MTKEQYLEVHDERDDLEVVELAYAIDYSDMADYLQSWPDKLVSYVVDHLCDDHMKEFVRELYTYICEGDKDGPAFEEWRRT